MASAFRILLVGALPILGLVGCNTTQPAEEPVTLEDVVRMTGIGSSSTAVANVALARGLDFPMNVDNIVWLREQGVPNPTIEALIATESQLRAQDYRPPPNVSIGLGFGYYGGYRGYRGYGGYGGYRGHHRYYR